MSQSDLTISQGSQSTSKTQLRRTNETARAILLQRYVPNKEFDVSDKKVGQVIRDIKK
jgi:hypothetical protein